MTRWLYLTANASLIALMFLLVLWEGPLAPLKPGGSGMILKVVPLMFPLFGILRGKVYTYQWSSMLILIYFAEGVVRTYTDTGLSAQFAVAETTLSLVFFTSAILYVREALRSQAKK